MALYFECQINKSTLLQTVIMNLLLLHTKELFKTIPVPAGI